MTATSRNADHLVIGGGPAGSMLAMRLASAGRRVLLVEKERGPHHKVCGEFLSREAIEYLHRDGVNPRQLGAVPIHTLRLSCGTHAAETVLPFPAFSLSRRTLDESMLAVAKDRGTEIVRGLGVESLSQCGSNWHVSLSNGQSLRAEKVFLASGKHNLRGFTRVHASQPDLIGFKMHWQLAPAQTAALRGYMDLYLFSGGYGGLSLVENEVANLCLVVRRSTLLKIGAWPQLLDSILRTNPHLQQLLESATPVWLRPLAISPIPYGYFIRESRGLWRLGDQAAVIPSFTGDGISIALHSAALAAQMFLAGFRAAEYHRVLRAQLHRSMNLATKLSHIAVTSFGRAAAIAVLPHFPAAMRWVATSTRISQSSLVLRNLESDGGEPTARQNA